MKKKLLKFSKKIINQLFIVLILCSGITIGAQTSIAVSNGDFQLPGTTKQSNWDAVPGWSSDVTASDSGVEDPDVDGNWTGFLYNKDGSTYNLTSHTITAGENYLLKLDARDIYASADGFAVTLYYDTGNGTRNVIATETFNGLTNTFTQVQMTASAPPAANLATLGIELKNNSTGDPNWLNNGWVGFDNLTLSYSNVSSNANLANITLSTGDLTPTFNTNKIIYTAYLDAGTTSVTPTVFKSDSNATVSGDGTVDVSSGYGMSQILVTAQDNTTQKTYTIHYVVYGATDLKHSYTFTTDASDSIGTAEGTLEGTATIVNGKAILDTAGDFISLGTATGASTIELNTYNAVTLEAFITAGDNIDYGGNASVFYFGETDDPDNPWKGYDYVYVQAVNGANSRTAISTPGNVGAPWNFENGITGPILNDGALHHVVLMIAPSAMTYYVDGLEIGTISFTGTNALSTIGSELAWLGKAGYQNDPTFRGAIDEFNIYEGFMEPSTIESRANAYTLSTKDFRTTSFKLFPNPSNGGDFSIQLNSAYTSNTLNVKVYNILGKELLNENFTPVSNRIDVKQDLSSGLYLIKVDNKETTKLLVK